MSDKRPTQEQLQTALTVADQSRPPRYVAVLAAEVRALQRDFEMFRSTTEADVRRLAATLTRVEALCDMQHDDRLILVSDIRAALRDQP